MTANGGTIVALAQETETQIHLHRHGNPLRATTNVKLILIATPDALLRADYQGALGEAGFGVATAENGVECLEAIRKWNPDLLVLDTDLLWGGADGVVAAVAQDPEMPLVPVLLITPRLIRTVLYEISRFSVSDCQTKPWSAKRLVERIRQLTESQRKVFHNTGPGLT